MFLAEAYLNASSLPLPIQRTSFASPCGLLTNRSLCFAAVVVYQEGDPNSDGGILAARYQVSRAPFFIVEDDDADARIYTVYMKMKKVGAKEMLSCIFPIDPNP